MSLAKTVFSTGPDDKEAVLDIYKKSNSSVYSGYQDTYNDIFTNKGLDTLLKGQVDPKSILESTKINQVLKELTSTGDKLNRLFGDSTTLKGLAQNLSSVAKNVLSLENNLKNAISYELAGFTSKILPVNLSDAKAIVGLVKDFTKNGFSGILSDKGALGGLVTSLSRQAVNVGLSGVFKAISSVIPDKSVLMCSARDLLPEVASTGNSNLFLEIANSPIGKEIKSIFPDVIGSVVKGLKLPALLQQQDYSKYYKDLSGGMRNVDNDWDKYLRVGSGLTGASLNGVKTAASKEFVKLLKASVFSNTSTPTVATSTAQVGFIGPFDPATADTATIKKYDDNNDKFLLLMDKYKTKDVGSELKEMLPSISITPDRHYQKALSAYVSPNISVDGRFISTGIDLDRPEPTYID